MRTHAKYAVFLLLILFIGAVAAAPARADTRYVSDKLIITMRAGQGNDYRIIKYLPTATPVEVLEKDGEFLKVRTKDGKEGWVHGQYIVSETPKTFIIDALKSKVGKLKDTVEGLQQERDKLKSDLQDARRSYRSEARDLSSQMSEAAQSAQDTAHQLKEMTEKYETLAEQSKNVTQIVQERDLLKAENERLNTTSSTLQAENERLMRNGMIKWFLAGGGVLLVGWIIGKISRQKRYY
ncbi:MAG: TIGR04211 family SH3 domain-containing protein [Nitrospirota bacterium]|jgi:SH3 domain protein